MIEFKTGLLIMLAIVLVCYSGTGIIQLFRNEYANGIMWLSYAVANGCLMIGLK